jgi:hypothetical protein
MINKVNDFLNTYFTNIVVIVLMYFSYLIFYPFDFINDYKTINYVLGRRQLSQGYNFEKTFTGFVFLFKSFFPYFIIQFVWSFVHSTRNKISFRVIKLNSWFLLIPVFLCLLSLYGLNVLKSEFIEGIYLSEIDKVSNKFKFIYDLIK